MPALGRPAEPLPDPISLYQQHHATLALAAGFITRYEASRHPNLDQASLVIALHRAYVAQTDSIVKRFVANLERGPYKPTKPARSRPKAVFGDTPIP